jgi:polynucleotide 5'-hydroxyl-kinase GRC3/NOL9
MDDRIRIEPSWNTLLEDLMSPAPLCTVYVVGAVDRGKTTLCRFLEDRLFRHYSTAYLDCDPGQSIIGPPASIGMKIKAAGKEEVKVLAFIGSTSPRGHMLQALGGIMRLTARAKETGAERIILDSSGFVMDGPAREYQYTLISTLRPEHVAAIQTGVELEDILASFDRCRTIRLRRLMVSGSVRPRDQADRQAYRMSSFRKYFTEAALQDLDCRGLGMHGSVPDREDDRAMENLLVGLCDPDGFMVALGVVKAMERQRRILSVYAPGFDPAGIASLQFGSTRLDTKTWKDY